VKKDRHFVRFLNVGGLYVKEVRLFLKLPLRRRALGEERPLFLLASFT